MAISTVSYLKTPQATDDLFTSVSEDSLIATLNVMANDLGGNAKTLYSLDDGNLASDLLSADAVGAIQFSALGAKISITSTGQVLYDASLLAAQVQYLHAGETFDDTFTYAIRMANGTLSWATATVRLAGANDTASMAGDTTALMNEDQTTAATGTLVVTDADHDESNTVAASGTGSNALGTYTVDADGQWSYTLDNSLVQHLTATASATDSFTVTSLDGTASKLVTITINGVNDLASITGDATGTLTEESVAAATGTLAVSDVDDGEAHTLAASGAGVSGLGSFTVDADGAWTYTVDNSAVQHLTGTASTSDSFVVGSLDGTDSQTVTITINGVNDLASISGDTSGILTEDSAAAATGQLVVSDVDDGEAHTVAASGSGASGLGSFTVDADGSWTYTVDNSLVQHLTGTASTSDSFVVASLDGTDSQTVTITINGVNDLASITGDTTGTLTEESVAAATGTLTVSDVDDGEAHAVAATGTGASGLGSFTVDADGAWTYTVDNTAVQHLTGTASTSDSFVVASLDGTDSQTVTITINGVNDLASISGTATGTLDEDASSPATGTLVVADVDDGEAHTVADSGAGASGLGSFTVDADGNWTYTVDNTAVQHLTGTASTSDSFVVGSLDGTDSQTITITINGVNDGASITGDTSGTLTEDSVVAATGVLAVNDVDDGEAHTIAASGSGASGLGSFTVDADGSWTYTVDNSAVQHLTGTASTSDSFVVASLDGTGSQTVTITMNGVNDLASITGNTTGTLTEESIAAATGVLAVNDVDDGEAHTVAASGAGASGLGSFTVDADGSWTYTVDNSAVQHLTGTASTSDSFVVASLDGTDSQTVTITISGVNDLASIAGDTTGTLTEESVAAATGTLVVSDVDDGEAHAVAATGTGASGLGSFTVDADGNWTYTVDNSAVQHLTGTASTSDSFVVASKDGTDSQTVTITINGVNDLASIGGGLAGAVTEDGTLAASGTASVSDVDDGQDLFGSTSSLTGTYGNFTFDLDTGAWTYTLRNGDANVQALASGQTVNDSLELHSLDGTATSSIVVSVTGANEPVVSDPNDHDDLGLATADTLNGDGAGNTIYGGAGDDNIDGKNGNDTLYGGSGNDTITGNVGDDVLYGGSGNDTISGNNGFDTFYGGFGQDVLTGGNQADTFKYLSVLDAGDTIKDFDKGAGDKLGLHDLLSSVGGPHDAGAFSQGYVQFAASGSDTLVMFDADGSAGSALAVVLATITNQLLTQADTPNYIL